VSSRQLSQHVKNSPNTGDCESGPGPLCTEEWIVHELNGPVRPKLVDLLKPRFYSPRTEMLTRFNSSPRILQPDSSAQKES
jgi:hypothetical protein